MLSGSALGAERLADHLSLELADEAENYCRENAIRIFKAAGASDQAAKLLAGYLSLGAMLTMETFHERHFGASCE